MTSTPTRTEASTQPTVHPNRWGPVCGIVTAALAVSSVVINVQLPKDSTSAPKVVAYLTDHHSAVAAASFIGATSAVTLVLFAAYLREVLLRGQQRGAALPNAAFGGAPLLAVGIGFTAIINLSAERAANNGYAVPAQTLSIVSNNGYFLNTTGIAALLLAAGIATVRTPVLPRWLGWTAIVIGLVSLAGPAGPIAAPLAILWVAVTAILTTVNPNRMPHSASR
jgi:hypothetical protein